MSHQLKRGRSTPVDDSDTESAAASRRRQTPEQAEQYGYARSKAKVTLPAEITAWLNKEMPE